MSKAELKEISSFAVETCLEAGKSILELYKDTEISTKYKSDNTPLTEADCISQRIINESLFQLTPEIPILSEEGSKLIEKEQKEFWLVDPLDGTKEFINKNGEFTVNIALVRENEVKLGVVFAPEKNELFCGIPGHGSFKQHCKGRENIAVTNLNKTKCRITLSKSHKNEGDIRFEEKSKKIFTNVSVIPAGSTLKLCRVAEGKADVYCRLGSTYQWDIAAGQAVVEGAGGKVIDFNRKSLNYFLDFQRKNPKFLCVGDPSFNWSDILEGL